MKIKIFESGMYSRLEQEINEFLDSIEPQRTFAGTVIVDIKYNTYVSDEYQEETRTGQSMYYSAMVIYK